MVDYRSSKMKCFENRFLAICDPIGWLSELLEQRDYIKIGLDLLSAVIDS